MIEIDRMTYFLDIEFHKSKKGMLMHQRRYALEILKKFEIEHCNAAIIAAEPRLQLSKNENEEDVDPTHYRMLIGYLCYVCNTLLDLEFSVGIVSRFMGETEGVSLGSSQEDPKICQRFFWLWSSLSRIGYRQKM